MPKHAAGNHYRNSATTKAKASKIGAYKANSAGGTVLFKNKMSGTSVTDKSAGVIGFKMVKGMGLSAKSFAIRAKMGVTQEELGRVTGYSIRSIAGWEAGQKLSEPARQKIAETERLYTALAGIIPAKEVGEWLRTPNPAFEGQPPMQVIERGESDRIWRMIWQIGAGVAS